MTQDFAQDFVLLRGLRLAAEPFAELRLYHREDRLDVAPLVVVRLKLRLVELVEVVHPLPKLVLLLHVVVKLTVRDVRDGALNQRQTAVVEASYPLSADTSFIWKPLCAVASNRRGKYSVS